MRSLTRRSRHFSPTLVFLLAFLLISGLALHFQLNGVDEEVIEAIPREKPSSTINSLHHVSAQEGPITPEILNVLDDLDVAQEQEKVILEALKSKDAEKEQAVAEALRSKESEKEQAVAEALRHKEAELSEQISEKEETISAFQAELERLKSNKMSDEDRQLLAKNSARRKKKMSKMKELLEKQKSVTQIVLEEEDYDQKTGEEIDIINGSKPFQSFFAKFFNVLEGNAQKYDHSARLKTLNGKAVFENIICIDNLNVLNEAFIGNILEFPEEFVSDLFHSHYEVVSTIPDQLPLPFYKGDGYVIVGGGSFSWYAYLTLQTLRISGSKLPVEIIIPDDEDYEPEFCETLAPVLGAKCVLLSRVFGQKNLEKLGRLSGYQYKSFALLASSFKNAFLLDSDSMPVSNPDSLFTSELFEKFKFLTWPDLWRRTSSPYFYEVTGREVKENQARFLNDVFTPIEFIQKDNPDSSNTNSFSYHEREGTLLEWTTESGEMLINKEEHFNTLLLSLYYNYNGPTAYFPLLSQGGAGEGDKETFVAAAAYYGKPYYQNYKAVDRLFGIYNEVHKLVDSTLVQYDPVQDFDILIKAVHRNKKQYEANHEEYRYDYEKYFRFPWNSENSKPMFYHIHYPKLDPVRILREKLNYDLENQKLRMLGNNIANVRYDVEATLWALMHKNLCVDKLNFQYFSEIPLDDFCNTDIVEQMNFLKESSEGLVTELGSYKSEIDDYYMSEAEIEDTKAFIYNRLGVSST